VRASDRVVRFAVSPFGAALDVHCVRYTGHSLVGLLFAKTYGSPYNQPLLLETTGARTGRRRRAVLPYFPAGDAIAIVGSRGGMPTDPHWVHNLRANPEALVRIARRPRRVRARIATGGERAKLWAGICERAPVYVAYQKRATTREIPVVVLDPFPGPGSGTSRPAR
jgi:deazaflavin-dependent oxidoreductase (nitroreductase family)